MRLVIIVRRLYLLLALPLFFDAIAINIAANERMVLECELCCADALLVPVENPICRVAQIEKNLPV